LRESIQYIYNKFVIDIVFQYSVFVQKVSEEKNVFGKLEIFINQTILFNSTFHELKNCFPLQYSVYNIHNNFIQEILF